MEFLSFCVTIEMSRKPLKGLRCAFYADPIFGSKNASVSPEKLLATELCGTLLTGGYQAG